jgi:hypothetical protein
LFVALTQTLISLRTRRSGSPPGSVQIVIQELGVDLANECVRWVKGRLDYESLFSILDVLRLDTNRQFWIGRLEASEDNCDIGNELAYNDG